MLRDEDPTPQELYESPHWYACRTRARAEKKVEARLEQAGFEAFLPLVDGANATGAPPEPADYLEPGQEVVVTSGPFEGMRGVLIEQRRGGARVAVRITALRQATSVEVGRHVVRAVGSGKGSSAA